MCLTIPKKVISAEGDIVTVENPNGGRQKVKTIVRVKTGDYILSQQNVIIQKIGKKEAEELINLIKDYDGKK